MHSVNPGEAAPVTALATICSVPVERETTTPGLAHRRLALVLSMENAEGVVQASTQRARKPNRCSPTTRQTMWSPEQTLERRQPPQRLGRKTGEVPWAG